MFLNFLKIWSLPGNCYPSIFCMDTGNTYIYVLSLHVTFCVLVLNWCFELTGKHTTKQKICPSGSYHYALKISLIKVNDL